MAELWSPVSEDGRRSACGLAFIAIHVAITALTADIQTSKVMWIRVDTQGMVDPKRKLRGIIAAKRTRPSTVCSSWLTDTFVIGLAPYVKNWNIFETTIWRSPWHLTV